MSFISLIQVPFSKILTFFRRSPFTLQAEYDKTFPGCEKVIGTFTIKDVAPNAEGGSQKVIIFSSLICILNKVPLPSFYICASTFGVRRGSYSYAFLFFYIYIFFEGLYFQENFILYLKNFNIKYYYY